MKVLFPHDSVRPVQEELMKDIGDALEHRKNLLAHAPTGLGKTAAVLSVALPFAIEHDLTLFFLTNRHTQHRIAVDTLRAIKEKHHVDFAVADLIGKKWMCLQDGVQTLYQQEFTEYCKAVRENNTCHFYSNLYRKNTSSLSVEAQNVQANVLRKGVMHVGEVKEACAAHDLCPYYFSAELAKQARVIIGDYNNIFHPVVRQSFFSRAGKELEKSILIIDEGHNLAERIRAAMSTKLSTPIVRNALQEAQKFGFFDAVEILAGLQQALDTLCAADGERVLLRDEFVERIAAIEDYDKIVAEFEMLAENVRETRKRSFLGSVSEFLRAWKQEDDGFVRYVERKSRPSGMFVAVHYSCLDAAQLSAPVFEKAYASVLMSGTLTPLEMFRDVLGIPRSMERVYSSPFPREHRLALVVPETSTQFRMRSTAMFERIAAICGDIVDAVPGNSAFFFPSYAVRDEIVRLLQQRGTTKQLFIEKVDMSADDKAGLLRAFQSCKDEGAALCAVAAANFSEGVDLPGDYLKAVVVVGLPLTKPDLYGRALIQYYDKKFGCGWDYGCVYPAMTKCLQAAGRCIRSELDRGAVVFLDQRFIWPRYYRCLPPDWNLQATRQHVEKIRRFFGNL